MTLEEKLIFYSHDDAVAFQKFLRDMDCSSRISIEHTFSGEPFFKGSISAFLALFDAFAASEDIDAPAMKEDLELRKKAIEAFYAEHKVLDTISDASPSQLMAQLQSINAVGEEAVKKEATEKFISSLMVLSTLEENGILTAAGDDENAEFTLTAIIPADDLKIVYPYTEFSGLNPDDLKRDGITSFIETTAQTAYAVSMGADIVTADVEKISDFLEDMDVNETEMVKFIDTVFFKQLLTEKIHDIVGSGIASEAGILDALDAPAFPVQNTNDEISFNLTPEYLTAVIADLRKLGVLSGKDGKIKSS
ncbi:MAG: hypothetical protein Q4Q04_03490 [Methanocorpusculum sp.]|nr:hypothetical protein [Methanocorpusculum sp.]